jgi:hypothetical protein
MTQRDLPDARIGGGCHPYEVDADGDRLPEGMNTGFGQPREDSGRGQEHGRTIGDGKETDGTTNPPVNQTNPALFAVPHIF